MVLIGAKPPRPGERERWVNGTPVIHRRVPCCAPLYISI
jgi:hypothetical protein